jgi:hypothetical protein
VGNTRQATAGLRGGRSSLLESAQEATLLSVATSSFLRQCNGLPALSSHNPVM